MIRINPLYIPELLVMIAECLDKRHVAKCLQVCRLWYDTLTPLVWRSVDVNPRPEGTPNHVITRECLLKYSNHVFDLSDKRISPKHLNMTFPNLRTVYLSDTFGTDKYNSRGKSYASELIALNPSLVNVIIIWPCPTPDLQFWRAVSNLPCLKKFRAFVYDFGKDKTEAFWRILSKLEEIYLLSFPMNSQQPKSAFYPLRKVTLCSCTPGFAVQLQFIRSCPRLEYLRWEVYRETEVLDEFANDMEHELWPRLEAIHLRNAKDERYLSRLLNRMQRVTSITMRYNQLGVLSFQSLKRHFSTLTYVDVVHCPAAKNQLILEILNSCPLLEYFAAKYLNVNYIVNCSPWVCVSLKELYLRFDFTESERDIHQLVFKHLSTLTRLVNIRIDWCYDYGTPPPTGTRLDMRLKSGLRLLSSWKNIRSLDLGFTRQDMEEADVQWIISNWSRIEFIDGKLNQDPQVNGHLRAILRAQGIKGCDDGWWSSRQFSQFTE